MDKDKVAVIIVGPTASGKTLIGHYLAKKFSGEIVNGDSMQVYRQLPIITSSPSNDFKQEINYHLYNFLNITDYFSAAKYCTHAINSINNIYDNNKIPIIVGGSGLYINMLINGYTIIPKIENNVKIEIKRLFDQGGIELLREQLLILDPLAAVKIKPNDIQRTMRALEVVKQTGKSIIEYNNAPNFLPLPNFKFKIIFVNPDRSLLYTLINLRTIKLIDLGAIDEVRAVQKTFESDKLLASKALGVSEIINYLNNKITKDQMLEIISLHSRRYAKRQITWFKNQLSERTIFDYTNIDEFNEKILTIDINI